MTLVQNEYHKRKETERANRANEEIKRNELSESKRHNWATERETNRSNLAKEYETNRTNLANEGIKRLEANSKVLLNQSNARLNDARTQSENVSRARNELQLDRDKEVYGSVNNELAGTLEPIRQGANILGSVLGAVGTGVSAIATGSKVGKRIELNDANLF